MNLEASLEGVLFYKTEPVAKDELARVLNVSAGELEKATSALRESLSERGLMLIETEDKLQLTTHKDLSEIIESVRKDELRKDIGKAGAETLAIILYRGPATRATIDFIRGVNSTFIIRNLLIRGLIERKQHPTDQRSFVYSASPQLMAHLGIEKKEDMPRYGDVLEELSRYEREFAEEGAEE